jgi:lauroyl/myristoyl acyltransferase
MHLTLLSEGLDFIQVHGAEHGGSDSWIGQRFMRGYRRALEAKVVPETVDIQEGGYSYLRRIKARLAANGVVCMPGMGPKGRRFIQLDFLGGKASIATGVASLSLSSGASLIPVYCFRDRKGVWRTVFEEPAPIDPTENRRSAQEALVEWYARTLESYVRRYPTQWRRWHANSASAGTTDLPAVSVDRSLQNRGEVS